MDQAGKKFRGGSIYLQIAQSRPHFLRSLILFPMSPLHFQVLPKSQLAVWKFFSAHSKKLEESAFYLAGGTALALQLGHRQSLDFDFFSEKRRAAEKICEWLESSHHFILRGLDQDALHGEFRKTKISFIAGYRYPLVQKSIKTEGLSLASIADIGLMKLLAITHRATLRDYLDLAAILRDRISLSQLIQLSPKKYGRRFNPLISLKALVSFEDVDQEMPVLLDKKLGREWRDILRQAVRQTS